MITYAFQAQKPKGVLFGLPKVHKKEFHFVPFCPPSELVGIILQNSLSPILKNSPPMNSQLKILLLLLKKSSFQNSDNFVMASFDIKSLFNKHSTRMKLAIDIAANSLYSDNNSFLSLSITQFRKFLGLAVKNTLFHFNDKLYRQIDGVAMGSPLGPSFANIFFAFTRPYGFKIVLQTSNQLCIGDMLMIPSYYL